MKNSPVDHLTNDKINQRKTVISLRNKLIERIILHADYPDEIKRLIYAAIKMLTAKSFDKEEILRFIDSMATELQDLKLINQESALQVNLEEALEYCKLEKLRFITQKC